MSISLNMIFWAFVITIFYCIFLFVILKDKKQFKDKLTTVLVTVTVFYMFVIAGIFVIFPEQWF